MKYAKRTSELRNTNWRGNRKKRSVIDIFKAHSRKSMSRIRVDRFNSAFYVLQIVNKVPLGAVSPR